MRKNRLNPKILVIGSISMDLVVRTSKFPRNGETVIGSGFHRSPGGKGANQAVAAARMGADVTIIGKLGSDEFGDALLNVLNNEGVNTKFVLRDAKVPTGVALINLDKSGNNRISVVPGANMQYSPEELIELEDQIKGYDIILLQLEMDMTLVTTAIDLASKHHVPVILNPAPIRDLPDELLNKVTYLTPNETEAETLTGVRINELDDAYRSADILLEKGIKNTIITLGAKGALIAGKMEKKKYLPGFSVSVVDSVAAGDSFNGALAYALVKGESVYQAVGFANAVGALTVTKQGAIPSLPKLEEVASYLNAFPSLGISVLGG